MWYTIKSTDKSEWLSSLAQKYLGEWQRYMEIYEANTDILTRGPDHVEPGMTLWIPVDGKQRPSNTTISTTTSIAPSVKMAGFDMNKILIAGGAIMLVSAIYLATKK